MIEYNDAVNMTIILGSVHHLELSETQRLRETVLTRRKQKNLGAGWHGGDPLDWYSGSAWLQSQPEHRLSY
jgi:hypothetical protein